MKHLHPVFLNYTIPAIPTTAKKPGRAEQQIKIYVLYSHHCFTRSREDVPGHTDDQLYTDIGRNETRVFCPQRWQQSQSLPNIVAALGARRCFITRHDNFFTVDLGNGAPLGDYTVYFQVEKHRAADAQIYIESAYFRTDQPHLAKAIGKIGFNAILTNILRGTRPVRPPR